MKKTIFTLLTLAIFPAFSQLGGQLVRGTEAISYIAQSLPGSQFEGVLDSGNSCILTLTKLQNGSLDISISSGIMGVQLASTVISRKVFVLMEAYSVSLGSGTAYTYREGNSHVRVSITKYDSNMDFDLSIEAKDKSVSCHYLSK